VAKWRGSAARVDPRRRGRSQPLGAGAPGFGGALQRVAVDRRGRGHSGDAPDYALEREYEDVVAVVVSAGDGVSVLGHSYGGICALEAALLTDGIRKLVLYEPPMGYLKSGSPVDLWVNRARR
jgi:pimeloyl-ACP methyl ester carboxylesterase